MDYLPLFSFFGTEWEIKNNGHAIADCCPFCGKEKHCYLNVEKGLYDCKSCGVEGNYLTFIRHVHKVAMDETTDNQYQQLRHVRNLPIQTLKRHSLAYHNDLGCWLVPSMTPKGEVFNLLCYYPPTEGKSSSKRNLPCLPTGLFGLEHLSDDESRTLFVCEGPFDLLALDHHFLDKHVRERYDIIAVPSASTFKEEWRDIFKRRKIRLVYDNDEAGQKGQKRATELLSPVAAEVFTLQWPEGFPQGSDVGDLVQMDESVAEFTRNHCKRVGVKVNQIKFIRGDQIPDEPLEWLWEGHIPFATFVSFSGWQGTQKSCIARDIVARATAGLPMPGCKKRLEPFDVFYFTSEDSAATVCDLIRAAGGDLTRVHVHDIKLEDENPIDILMCLKEIEARTNSNGVRLIIFDAFNSFVGGDISTDAKARRTQSGRLQWLAQKTGACVIGIRNWNRMDTGTGSQRALGATSLSDVSRCVMNTKELDGVIRDGKEIRQFLLEFEKVSHAPRPGSIPYEVEDLSTDNSNSHLRRIIWEEVPSSAQTYAGEKKVA